MSYKPEEGVLARSYPLQLSPHSTIHVGALDGLRGLAILLVMYYHYGASAKSLGLWSPAFWPSAFGWCGVDLFFVLSGFLITGILYDSKRSAHYFRNFYVRRILRIAPLYYAALLFVVLLSLAWPSAIWGTANPLWYTFYLTNFLIVAHGQATTGVLAHYWSLSVEEHFYLVWPLLVYGASRRRMMQIAGALAAAALVLRIFLVTQGVDRDVIYNLTPTRIDALAIGGFISLALRGPHGINMIVPKAWIALLTSAALMLAVIGLRGTLGQGNPALPTIVYSLLAAIFGGLIIIGMTWSPLKAVLNFGMLRWFGKYSYGLYIWHPIIGVIILHSRLAAAMHLQEQSHLAVAMAMAGTFALSLLTAWLSYHLFEKHFLDLKRYFSNSVSAGKSLTPNSHPLIAANV